MYERFFDQIKNCSQQLSVLAVRSTKPECLIVMSGYYVGVEKDFKYEEQGMLATAEDVGIFLRALNDGSVFNEGEQEIYSSIYVYEHTGLLPGYQSIAKY